MKLLTVHPSFVDEAWFRDGASCLARACEFSGGDVTGDQLKMLLSRGERTLIRMDVDGEAVGWGVTRIDQLPNIRVLHVCEMVAPGAHFERFFEQLKELASKTGCSRIRCSCKPAQARLFKAKVGFQPVYETLEVVL